MEDGPSGGEKDTEAKEKMAKVGRVGEGDIRAERDEGLGGEGESGGVENTEVRLN